TGTTDTFTIKVWTNTASQAPGTIEQTINLTGTDAGYLRTDISGGAGTVFQYQYALATPITLSAGTHWFEVYFTNAANTNDWNMAVAGNADTSTTNPIASSTNSP